MISMPWLSKNGRALLLLSTLSCASLSLATAQQRPAFKVGEIILYCQPNTPDQQVQALAAKVGAEQVVPLALPDCYKLILPANLRTEMGTTDSVAKLRGEARVRWVDANTLTYPTQTPAPAEPNDPRYKSGEMWGLNLIKMPQAWALQKGGNIVVAVIDTGFAPTHEDLQGQYHARSRDIADGDDDITAGPPAGANAAQIGTHFHGSHVSGTIIAKTNNGVGVAGICWENVKCLAIKGAKTGGDGSFPIAELINAFRYVSGLAQELNIKVLNLSLGGGGNPIDASSPVYVALKEVSDKNVLVVTAAGNDSASSTAAIPAGYPFVFNVSALRRNGQPTSFTNFDLIKVGAPGGELNDGQADGILSTLTASTYTFEQGTSMAAPHVSGVAGLLLSTPGTTIQEARNAMTETANRSRITGAVPDKYYGFGVLDAGAAMARVSVRVEIEDPIGTDPLGNTTDPTGIPRPIETLRPILRFTVNQVPLTTGTLTVTIDGQVIPLSELTTSVETGVTTGQAIRYTVAVRMPKALALPGEHTLVVQGTNPTAGTTARAERRFTISPHVIPAGISFISIPYFESAVDSPTNRFREARNTANPLDSLFGNDVTLYRWIYLQGQVVNGVTQSGGKYAQNGPAGSDLPDNAKFQPADAQTTLGDDTSKIISPVGLAYFIKTPASVTVSTYGIEYTKKSVRIPLHEGWNMIGDPYGYTVSFNTVLVEDKAGTRYTAQEASERGVILPYIYRFVGGDYQFQALPNGILAPWEGHWIYVVPKNGAPNPAKILTLIVQPVQGGTASRSASATTANASSKPRVSGSGSWALRLEARTRTLVDSANYIGTTTRAASDRLNSVPKPPKPSPYVSLGISKTDAPNGIGLYAQDLQTAGGTKTWDVVVNTDQAESDVVVSWPEVRTVPRNVRLTMTDKSTGQTIDLRQQSSFRYNTGRSVEPRSFVITAKPSAIAGRALVTNLMVNPVRTAGRSAPVYEINYSLNQDVRVEMSILSASGKLMATVGNTRAATVGDNRAVWNGRDNSGRELPAGLYVLQVRAITGDNEMTRSVTSFLMTR